MATQNPFPTPALDLFFAFKRRFDTQDKLKMPSEGVSIAELWNLLSQQLELKTSEVAQKIAEMTGHQCVVDIMFPPHELISKFPVKIATERCLIPIRKEKNCIVFASANPLDPGIAHDIQFIFGIQYMIEVAPPEAIESEIASAYHGSSSQGKGEQFSLGTTVLDSKDYDSSIPRLAQQLLAHAIKYNATDLHIHPYPGGSVVRIRIDGLLRPLTILPDDTSSALLRFFKSHAAMDPSNSIVPQDGQIHLELEGKSFDLRLSSLPVSGRKEKLAIRFLGGSFDYKLSLLGISHDERHRIRQMINNPSGVILVCGPTGSGKSTTLYSILTELNQPEVSIVTVENPVEHHVPGVSQTEINEKAGLTFDGVLKTILRQDPDIILIGEIRDTETAKTAMQAALTGHLVLSTLHTNEAYGAFTRLIDLGVSNLVINEALRGVISQRLLRKLCVKCRTPVTGELSPVEEVFTSLTRAQPAYRAVGCEACQYSGYKGRIAIMELFQINDRQRSLLRAGIDNVEQLRDAGDENFSPIARSAAIKIISGDTSAEEVYRVLGQQFWLQLAEEYRHVLPDLGAILDAGITTVADKPEIIIAGAPGRNVEALVKTLEDGWYRVHRAESPEKTSEILLQNENVILGILDLPDHLDDAALMAYMNEYRKAWARTNLPAMLRYPEGKQSIKDLLLKHGYFAYFISQSVPATEVLRIIAEAQKKVLNYNWGLDG